MSLADAYLAEFEQEAATTRRFLERLPNGKLNWKPHEKSMTAGQLALHIATAPAQVLAMSMVDRAELPDMSGPNPQPTSLQEVLQAHDESTARVRSELPKIGDARMGESIVFSKGGKEVLSFPRGAMLRSIMLNHWIHHRGQFGVYLRLLGASVPSSYGPSGDELPDFMKAM